MSYTIVEFDVYYDTTDDNPKTWVDAFVVVEDEDGETVDFHVSDILEENGVDITDLDEYVECSFIFRNETFENKEDFAVAFEEATGISFSGNFEHV